MSRRRALLSAALAVALVTTSGCGVIMRFIGERVADAITQKTADLKDASLQAMFTTNLYPSDAKTFETEVMGEAWAAGKNVVNLNVLKRAGIGMWEIDGTVTARKAGGPAEPMKYFGKGAYYLLLPANDRAPRTIEIRTASGQALSIPVKPAAPVKLKAVNGKPANATVDLTKDLVLELDDPGAGKLKVSLIASTMGIRTMTDLAVCKPAKRIVIPAAAYKHMGVSASAAGFVGVDPGANYVMVERYDATPVARPAPAGAAFTVGKSWSHSPVTVTGDVKNAAAITVEGTAPNPRGGLHYVVSKPQAFSGPPVARARKVALGSLAVRGVLFKQTTNVSTSYGYQTVTTTTTTTTLAFPKVAPAAWDRLLDDAAGELAGVLRGMGGNATMLPPERVTGTAVYATLEEAKDEVGEKLVERAYKKTRPVFATSAAAQLAGISSTFALDRPIVRMMAEAGADAVLAATIDLQIATQKGGDKLVLVPRLNFNLVGGANGYNVGPTSYGSGFVTANDGVPFSKAELEDLGALRRIARLDDLMGGLGAALGKLREAERAAGYEAIWALQ